MAQRRADDQHRVEVARGSGDLRRVADPVFAVRAHLELAAAGHARHVGVMLFPELGLSSYAIDDLLLQAALLDRAEAAVAPARHAGGDAQEAMAVHAVETGHPDPAT